MTAAVLSQAAQSGYKSVRAGIMVGAERAGSCRGIGERVERARSKMPAEADGDALRALPLAKQ